jgi:hypothetical protein
MIDIYLACPYSDSDPTVRQQRFEKVNRFAAELMRTGVMVFSPISHTHPIAVAGELPKGWDFWERYDRTFLEMSRAMVVLTLPGYETSKGVKAETRIMLDMRRHIMLAAPDCFTESVVRWFESVTQRNVKGHTS